MKLPAHPDWYPHAACLHVDPEIFFPEKGGTEVWAKQVCSGCPVQAPCLELALERNETWGVWGGMSPNDRKALRRRRAAS